jgi:co-chaperonin GroES (HSP10)
MKALNNNVVIQFDNDHEKIGSLFVPFDQLKYTETRNRDSHISITGTVLAVPDELHYYGERIHELWLKGNKNRSESEDIELSYLQQHTTEYDVPMELQVGDRVWFKWTAKALNQFSECGIIKYDNIVIAKRGDKIIPLNGCVIVEPVKKSTLSQTGLLLNYRREEEMNKSVVVQCGKLVKGYRSNPFEYDSNEIFSGQTIYHDITTGYPIENEMFAELPKSWRYLWRKDILTYE